ncbi:MAG: hypothetical protein LC797_15520, partial [Chloroflexi bacterium]|nr:hypothetical protein [Chloroflexota bacterium]
LLSGDMHWLIKVLHLLVGIGAVGMAESLAVRTLRQRLRRDSPNGMRGARSSRLAWPTTKSRALRSRSPKRSQLPARRD